MDTRARVLALLREGKTKADIARELGISKPAIGKHEQKLIELGEWQRPGEAQPKAKEGKGKASRGETPSPSQPKPKTIGGRKPPPLGPNKGSFTPGNPGGPGGPKRNKKAVTHGLHESIHADAMDPDELLIYTAIDTGVGAQIEEGIRLHTLRERRMMKRIADLKAENMTLVEETKETDAIGLTITKEKRAGTLGQIQAIEDALTKVAEKKAKLIALKADLEKDKPPGDQLSNLDRFLAGVDAVVEEDDDE